MGKAKKAPKTAGGKGAKRSKIPRPVQSRVVALAGLLALSPIAWLLLTSRIDLQEAAQRAVLVLAGLMLIERLAAPVFMAILNSTREPRPESED